MKYSISRMDRPVKDRTLTDVVNPQEYQRAESERLAKLKVSLRMAKVAAEINHLVKYVSPDDAISRHVGFIFIVLDHRKPSP